MPVSFSTYRLDVAQIELNINRQAQDKLSAAILHILTPEVVASLPDYFHNVDSIDKAKHWLDRMLMESILLQVRETNTNQTIGFIFIYQEHDAAHIGYLLATTHWRKGLANEVLSGLIGYAREHSQWSKLVGGVDKGNFASANLLTKLGFQKQQTDNQDVDFYEYKLCS